MAETRSAKRMIDFNQIEQELGVQTLMTDKQQAAI